MPDSESQDKKRTSQMVLIIVGVIVAAAVIFGGGAFLFAQVFSGHIKSPDEYAKTELTPDSYSATITCAGKIRALKSSSVSPEVDGVVSSVKVKEGEKVKKGATLMTIKNDSVKNAAKSAKKTYDAAATAEERAKASLDSANAAVKAAQKRKDRAVKAAEKQQKKLEEQQEEAGLEVESTEVTVDSSYDDAIQTAQSTADSADASYKAAQSNAENARSAYKAAQEQAKLLTVKAGESGTVVNLKAEKGMTVANLNAQGAAMQIADLDSLVGVVAVPEANINSVARGQEATIKSEALPDDGISATVSKIADAPNDSDGKDGGTTYNVTLTIGSDSDVKIDMSISAEIRLQDFGTVYYVPASAVLDKDGVSYVEVIYNDGTTEQHQVTVVGTADDGSKIIKGDTLAQGTSIRSDLAE